MTTKIKKKISAPYVHAFQIEKSGLVAIFVSARCKSAKQIKSRTDEDLRAEIDGFGFRELLPEKYIQQYNIPASFNGSELKGLKKTVVFFVMLKKGTHIVNLIPRPSAYLEDIIVQELMDQKDIAISINEQAEDGDRRPWFTFVLAYATLKSFTISASVQYRLRDSDDLKIIIDNAIQEQEHSRLHRFWAFAGNFLKKIRQEKEQQEKIFSLDFPKTRHYIEIWADRIPILHAVALEIDPAFFQDATGETKKRIPTVDDPKWTGDFVDDTEQMILARAIWGEARDQNKEARIAVAWSIRNRVEDNRWADTYHAVILEYKQYSAFWEEIPNDNNLMALCDPIGTTNNSADRARWTETYEIAGKVIGGDMEDYSNGANFYHDTSISQREFYKRINLQPRLVASVGRLRFYYEPK
ncbi:MAG: hypothetical protein CO042_00560 [Parcubacteria group bacterium CG_4_9_14_0_2_um_filter_41_8]|nr:MAG: hypothetical protein CO042_00560 [Parcubacteria group bacterium CG_4_9_14_0_2_um_filter_41_8]